MGTVTPPPSDDSELPEHRVAVTVFATVRAVDERDAGSVADVAVRQALRAASVEDKACVVTARFAKAEVPVRIAGVMETGLAAGNGYLWTAPTAKIYRERGDGH